MPARPVIELTPHQPAAGASTPAADARWVQGVRIAALFVFPGLIGFAVLRPAFAGRILWTIAIASLPLFFVLAGYHRWRRICPLAFVSQIPALLGRGGKRRAGAWMQAHAYRLSFAVFLVSLWLRLVATNGDGYAIAIFLAGISLAAFMTGAIFTGKTWCNHVCPVLFVEKLYTEPRGLRDTPNSQCGKCTACRPACPDINQENSYWREILVSDKRHVFFAFPGVVLAFYVYYYVQAGSWEYYFGGRWTREVGLIRTAFLPGVDAATAGAYFSPWMPRAVAAALTLLAGAVLSHALFSVAERPLATLLRRRHSASDASSVRHVVFSLAAFAAFITFYSFAGAPTLRLIPGLPHLFQLLVVTTGTLFLARRIGRRQRDFSEETLARKIIARWPWTDTPPPRDLREAVLIHAARSPAAGQAHLLELYKDAVRESVNTGVVTRREVDRLDALRTKLRIGEAEHERVMSELGDEDADFIISGPAYASPEKQLQLRTYADALAAYLDLQAGAGAPLDEAAIRHRREQHGITPDEHTAVLDYLVRSREHIAANLLDAPAVIEEAAAAIGSVEPARTSVSDFLCSLLRRRWIRHVEALLDGVSADAGTIRARLLSSDPATRRLAALDLASRLAPAAAARLIDAVERSSRPGGALPDLTTTLRAQLVSLDPYIRATAIYMLEARGEATDADLRTLEKDDHPLVAETLDRARAAAVGSIAADPTTLEKLIALRSISIFETLQPEDLIRLARASTEVWLTEGQALCREGEIGDEVYVLLAGEVSVLHTGGGGDRILAVQGAGSCIGELSVLDSAPREATVIASTVAVRALRLDGRSFRDVRDASPALSDAIIRLLAQRLRAAAAAPQREDPPRANLVS